jgi:hypothetical protein
MARSRAPPHGDQPAGERLGEEDDHVVQRESGAEKRRAEVVSSLNFIQHEQGAMARSRAPGGIDAGVGTRTPLRIAGLYVKAANLRGRDAAELIEIAEWTP